MQRWYGLFIAAGIAASLMLGGAKGGCLPDPVDVVEPAGNSCNATSDCAQFVVYYKDVKSEADCYCPMCDSGEVHLNKETLALYQKHFEAICGEWQKTKPCPIPKCILPTPRECQSNVCEPSPNPESFCSPEWNECAPYVIYYKPVEKPEDCYCIFCPRNDISLNQTTHERYRQQWEYHCSDWKKWRDYPCPVASCIQPFPKACVENHCSSVSPEP
ncbi:MAG: hypothetical protein KC609_13270 [Myxococcales bacterium]|nr:hypothetical protein [Myxococcales bacterium]